jgi:hypothetical protein
MGKSYPKVVRQEMGKKTEMVGRLYAFEEFLGRE